jgi:hypothetical protein
MAILVMSWTQMAKPTIDNWTAIGIATGLTYDDPAITYDSPLVFYDGGSKSWTVIQKPTVDNWTMINKPS